MSMDMRPGFFCSSLPGGCGRHSVLYGRGQFCRVRVGLVAGRSCPVLPGLVLLCLFQSIPVYSSLFQSIPVYSSLFRSIPVHSGPFRSIPVHSGPFRSIPVHSILFYSILFYSILFPSRSSPVQPSPVRSGSVPSVLSSPFPPRRSRPVPVQFSPAWPCPARPCLTRACLRERGSGPCRAGSLRAD